MVLDRWARKTSLLPLLGLVLLAVVGARLQMGGWSASHFVVHGEVFHHEASNITGVVPVAEGGYDGQFFTRLGFNPFVVEKDAFGIALDKPAYRAQRMFYPFLGWVLSFGDSRAVPFALVGVNVLALLGLYFLMSRLISLLAPDASAFYVPIVVLLPGFLFSLSRNLSEPLGVALAAASLLSLLKYRIPIAALTFSLACLTRETFSLTVFASGLWLLLFENPERPLKERISNLLVVWSAVIPILLWQGYLYVKLGVIGPLASQGNITAPFAGIFSQLLIWAGGPDGKAVANSVYLFWHALVALVVLWLLKARTAGSSLGAGQKLLVLNWIVVSLFMTLLSPLVWEDAWAFCRVLSEWSVLSVLIIATFLPRLPVWLAGYSFALSGLSLLRIMSRL